MEFRQSLDQGRTVGGVPAARSPPPSLVRRTRRGAPRPSGACASRPAVALTPAKSSHLGGVETEISRRAGGILGPCTRQREAMAEMLGESRGGEVSRLGGVLAHDQDVHRRSIVNIGGRRAPGRRWLGLCQGYLQAGEDYNGDWGRKMVARAAGSGGMAARRRREPYRRGVSHPRTGERGPLQSFFFPT